MNKNILGDFSIPLTFLLRCALIGATTGLIIRIIMLFVKKQPKSTWFEPLLKTDISGALLGTLR
jgi:hypothetical protein